MAPRMRGGSELVASTHTSPPLARTHPNSMQIWTQDNKHTRITLLPWHSERHWGESFINKNSSKVAVPATCNIACCCSGSCCCKLPGFFSTLARLHSTPLRSSCHVIFWRWMFSLHIKNGIRCAISFAHFPRLYEEDEVMGGRKDECGRITMRHKSCWCVRAIYHFWIVSKRYLRPWYTEWQTFRIQRRGTLCIAT